MLVATTALFGLGLIALVLDTSLAYQQFTREIGLFGSSSGSLWSTRRTNITTSVGATITCIIVSPSIFHHSRQMKGLAHILYVCACASPPSSVVCRLSFVVKYIISDTVCAWRAAVLWNYDRRVVAVLSLFILGTIGKLQLLSPPRGGHPGRS
jgi:hypothetical protein